MRTTYKRITGTITYIALFVILAFAGSCSKSQSYSELLRDEEHAVNNYLATQRVINEIPEDSISFEVGPDAPFYKLDEDGYIYMRVIDKGDLSKKVESGDVVYFRFNRLNLKSLYLGMNPSWEGNMNNLSASGSSSLSFIYKNTYLQSSSQCGQVIQWQLKFFGYDCEVYLVLQSYYGFSDDQTYCYPYLINLKYFAPEY